MAKTVCVVVLITLIFFCGCSPAVITPKCDFTNYNKASDLNNVVISIQVDDHRKDSERFYFYFDNGFHKFKLWEDSPSSLGLGSITLSEPASDMIEKSLISAFSDVGYKVSSDSNVVIKVELLEFLSYASQVPRNDRTLIQGRLSIHHKNHEVITKLYLQEYSSVWAQFWDVPEHLEETFSVCLSELVRKVVYDPDIEKALRSIYGLPPKVQPKPQPTIEPALIPQRIPTPSPTSSSGTGFAVCQSGYIVTACHVVDGADSIQVKFPGGEWISAQVIRRSIANDIAILKTDATLSNVLELTDDIKLGQKIFTVGYPVPGLLGVEPKYGDGSISSLSGIEDEASLMQVSIPLQPGNSGGPIINEKGQVVGMATSAAKVETFYKETGTLPQNVNWAIKSSFIRPMLPQECTGNGTPEGTDIVELASKSVCLIKAETY